MLSPAVITASPLRELQNCSIQTYTLQTKYLSKPQGRHANIQNIIYIYICCDKNAALNLPRPQIAVPVPAFYLCQLTWPAKDSFLEAVTIAVTPFSLDCPFFSTDKDQPLFATQTYFEKAQHRRGLWTSHGGGPLSLLSSLPTKSC